MIKIRKFDIEKDYDSVNEWCLSRKEKHLNTALIPPTTYIASENDEDILFICVYFILDVPIIMLDNFITNPNGNYWKMKRCWKIMFDFIKNLITNVEELSKRKYSVIQCTADSRLVKMLNKTDKSWIILNGTLSPCLYNL